MVQTYDPAMTTSPIDYGFRVLNRVSQGLGTKWSIIYDIHNMTIHFRTLYNQRIRTVMLDQFDYSCDTPVMTLNVNGNGDGNVSQDFLEYTFEMNRNLVTKVFGSVDFLKEIPAAELEYIYCHPATTMCVK
jgi:choloylglycine hydrolase